MENNTRSRAAIEMGGGKHCRQELSSRCALLIVGEEPLLSVSTLAKDFTGHLLTTDPGAWQVLRHSWLAQ